MKPSSLLQAIFAWLNTYTFHKVLEKQQWVVLYMPYQDSTKIVPKRAFDSVGDFDFKIPSPIAGEPKIYKTEEQCNE